MINCRQRQQTRYGARVDGIDPGEAGTRSGWRGSGALCQQSKIWVKGRTCLQIRTQTHNPSNVSDGKALLEFHLNDKSNRSAIYIKFIGLDADTLFTTSSRFETMVKSAAGLPAGERLGRTIALRLRETQETGLSFDGQVASRLQFKASVSVRWM
ncbi:hypothetical protein CEXT_741521 [Caerostris extrusa]|uniref:Uncharacterized protein n=1 Tax=Caerostris extrusa TaxID=172846 RepID=A0AAV4UCJ3_CAEEX|nr:hypothetical protein CEXT_741521 [Caerostris extrusa]